MADKIRKLMTMVIIIAMVIIMAMVIMMAMVIIIMAMAERSNNDSDDGAE